MKDLRTTEVKAPPKVYPGYMSFSLKTLTPATAAPCTVFLESFSKVTKRLRLTKVLDKGTPIAEAWLKKALGAGVDQAFVTIGDLTNLQAYLHRQSLKLLGDAGGDEEKKQRVVYENALCSVKAAMLDPKNGRRLALGVSMVRQTLDVIWDDKAGRGGLLRVMTMDRQLYTHCLNVCLLGVSFARAQKWPRRECESLGLALFFHDLGLIRPEKEMDPYQLCRVHDEKRFFDHPVLSCRYLEGVSGLDYTVRQVVLNHHESLDGSGFPRSLKADELGRLDRLARIVDVYESGTSGCLADKSESAYNTLKTMRTEMRHEIDQPMLEAFVRFLGQA